MAAKKANLSSIFHIKTDMLGCFYEKQKQYVCFFGEMFITVAILDQNMPNAPSLSFVAQPEHSHIT